jgi:hypothetical protein
MLIVLADETIAMHVDEVESGRGAPVAQQPRLDVIDAQRLFEERVRVQVDLAYREIIRGAPVGVHFTQFFGGKRTGRWQLHIFRMADKGFNCVSIYNIDRHLERTYPHHIRMGPTPLLTNVN